MGKTSAAVLSLLLVAALGAQETVKAPAGQEIWEAAFLDKARAGHFRTSFQPIEVDGVKLIRARQLLHLTVKRFNSTVDLKMESGTDETADGKVVGVFMEMQGADGGVKLSGTVKEGVLHVEVDKGRIKRQIPWNDKVIGQLAQEKLFHGRKFKTGDKVDYQSYEPMLNTVLTTHAEVEAEEEVELIGKKSKLFRVVLTSDKIEVPGASVQLPPMTAWMDSKGVILRRAVEIPPLGKVVLVRTTKDVALSGTDVAKLDDIGLKSLLRIAKTIDRPHESSKAVYRITIDDAKPETALTIDDRQAVRKLDGKAIELTVKTVSPPDEGKDELKDEFLKSCHFLDSDNEKVKALATKAVGAEKDAWKKAQRIERWVRRNMTSDATVPFSPAGQIAKELRGDCRQCAMLGAAMCRAAGVPSRTAIGLIYAEDRQGKPFFGFHMWFEVNVRGRWVGLDGTLGEGRIGAAHIKVTDHGWHDVQSLTPLLPLQRVVGKMKIEVLSVDH